MKSIRVKSKENERVVKTKITIKTRKKIVMKPKMEIVVKIAKKRVMTNPVYPHCI